MMDLLTDWVIGITCAAMALAAVQMLVPDGALRKVANLAGGLILLLVLAAPLTKLEISELTLALTEYRMKETGSSALLELENKRLVLEIVEEQTAAYILEKAEEMGIRCAVDVYCVCNDDGNVFSESVTIEGRISENEKEKLSRWIEHNLAILKENQTFEEGDVP